MRSHSGWRLYSSVILVLVAFATSAALAFDVSAVVFRSPEYVTYYILGDRSDAKVASLSGILEESGFSRPPKQALGKGEQHKVGDRVCTLSPKGKGVVIRCEIRCGSSTGWTASLGTLAEVAPFLQLMEKRAADANSGVCR